MSEPTKIHPVKDTMCRICRRQIFTPMKDPKNYPDGNFLTNSPTYCCECHGDGSVARYENNEDKTYEYRLGKHWSKWRYTPPQKGDAKDE